MKDSEGKEETVENIRYLKESLYFCTHDEEDNALSDGHLRAERMQGCPQE